MENILFLDLETRSPLNIKAVGSYKYAENCDILLFAYAMNDDDVNVIEYSESTMQEIQSIIDKADVLVAHNTMFDRRVLKTKGFKNIDIERWHDTIMQARVHGLPPSLEALCDFYKLPKTDAKDAQNGKRLINVFCKPSTKIKNKITYANPVTNPVDWEMFKKYAHNDITAMRACYKLMPKFNLKTEATLFQLDQKINDRGVRVDVDLAEKVLKLLDSKKAELNKETVEKTGGALKSATQGEALKKYVYDTFGFKLENTQKAYLETVIDDDEIPYEVKEILLNRNSINNSAVAKYNTIVNTVCDDGTVKGTLTFAGATRTGRWSGNLLQPQNLPRPHKDYQDTDTLIYLIKNDCLDLYTREYIEVASSCIRGAIIPADNKQLVVSDLSAIEGRNLAWLAGETWVINAYRDYDNGIGHDMYVQTYSKAFNVAADLVDKVMRQIGKVMELALGYQGGVPAFVNFAKIYRICLDTLANLALPLLPPDVIEIGKASYRYCIDKAKKLGITEKVWVAIDGLKTLWRRSHPKITSLWDATNKACFKAVENKGVAYSINDKLKTMCKEDGTLMIKLPSGRYLCYQKARIKDNQIHYVTYKNKKMQLDYTYGGKLVENITQAVARDILASMLPAIENNGFEILLTVHDEVITQAPIDNIHNERLLSQLMSVPPSWAADLPLAAEGFESLRYKKD